MDDMIRKIEESTDMDAFLSFLNELILDFRRNPEEWENRTVDLYLEAVKSWMEDYSSSAFNDIDWRSLSYSTLARMLYMGKIYE